MRTLAPLDRLREIDGRLKKKAPFTSIVESIYWRGRTITARIGNQGYCDLYDSGASSKDARSYHPRKDYPEISALLDLVEEKADKAIERMDEFYSQALDDRVPEMVLKRLGGGKTKPLEDEFKDMVEKMRENLAEKLKGLPTTFREVECVQIWGETSLNLTLRGDYNLPNIITVYRYWDEIVAWVDKVRQAIGAAAAVMEEDDTPREGGKECSMSTMI